jgi:hypothetical protein
VDAPAHAPAVDHARRAQLTTVSRRQTSSRRAGLAQERATKRALARLCSKQRLCGQGDVVVIPGVGAATSYSAANPPT